MTKLLFLNDSCKHYLNKFIFALFVLFLSPVIQAQTIIEATVLDERTSKSIIGANIRLGETNTGTVSDVKGYFRIPVNSFPVSINVTSIGYKPLVLEIYEYAEPLTLFLKENIDLLEEIVVVGYGTQKRKELTGAISSVPSFALIQPVTSFDNLLGGTVAGLNVSQTSGQPGATSTIRIRGGNSITGGNEPLYVIDGIIIYNDFSSTRTGASGFDGGLNPLTSINTSDIESVEVLKDVSATAIYGSRGANGVILITTKKGKKGSNTINYTASFGVSNVGKKLDLLDAEGWISLQKELGNNRIDEAGEPTDWQSEVLESNAISKMHQLSISGGDEKSRYLISGNYTRQDGIVRNTNFERYAGRLNLDRDVLKNLNVGVNVNISEATQNGFANYSSKSNSGRVSGSFDFALRQPPVVPVYNSDGNYNYSNPFSDGDFNFIHAVNPLSDLDNVTAETRNLAVLANVYANLKILSSLTARINLGTNIHNTDQNFYAPSTSAIGMTINGLGTIGNKKHKTWQGEYTLNYNKRFAEIHSLDVLAGFTNQQTVVSYFTAGATNFLNESLGYHNLGSGSNFSPPASGGAESLLYSWLGRINYSLYNRYNLTATLRADGSSRFPKDNHWGYFPSIGLSWNIHEESFLKQYRDLDILKLRLSVGTVGNQEIGDYRYEDAYQTLYYSFDGTVASAYKRSTLYNPDLKWETTTQYNAGIDFGVWKNRLTFIFDAYLKETSDLLVDIPVEQTTGFNTALRNVGKVTNKGVEFSVSGDIISKKNFKWTLSGNIAVNRNEITDLGGQSYFFPYVNEDLLQLRRVSGGQITIVKVGEPLGSLYGLVFDGVDPDTGEAKFVDQNRDGFINQDNDRVVLGSVQPDFTYGISSNLVFKKWDFSFLFQGSRGNELYNGLQHNLETVTRNYNVSANLADRWTTPGQITDVPKAKVSASINVDSRYVEDASFLKLKNITIGYTLPVKRIASLGTKLRVYASAQNLFTLTKYKGYNPESARYGGNETNSLFQGIDLGAYPSARTILFGVNLTLN